MRICHFFSWRNTILSGIVILSHRLQPTSHFSVGGNPVIHHRMGRAVLQTAIVNPNAAVRAKKCWGSRLLTPYMDSSCNARKKRKIKQVGKVRLRPYIRPLSGVLLHAGPRWTSRSKGESTYLPQRPLGCDTHLPPVRPFFPSSLLPGNRQRMPFVSTTQQLLTLCVTQRSCVAATR